MQKGIWSLIVLGACFTLSSQADDSLGDRFRYKSVDASAYTAKEWSLDLFGGFATHDRTGIEHGKFEMGVGGNYFFTRNWGVGADTYFDAVHVPYNLNFSGIYRYPLSDFGLAPYGFAGFGRQWEHAPRWNGHFGAGIEYRLNHNTGLFLDGRAVLPTEKKGYGLFRLGMRFAF